MTLPTPLIAVRPHLLIALALVAVTFVLYWPVHRYDFLNYDDTDYVTRNVQVQRGLTSENVAWAFGELHGEATYWHPLTWITHMLDVQFFGVQAGPHHLVNVLIHALNAALLFLVLSRMTGAMWCSAVVAALFAWHPLQIGTVAWIAERKNVLSTMFWLVTMAAYLGYARAPGLGRYALVVFGFLLGLASKAPQLVTLPFVLLLLDFWPLRRIETRTPQTARVGPEQSRPDMTLPRYPFRRLLWEKVPLLILTIAASLMIFLAHRGLGMARSETGMPFGVRVENALVSYMRYIGKTFWPSDLSILYLHPGSWPVWQVGLALVLLGVITGAVLYSLRRRRAPYLAVGWFWFLGVLVPFSGLVQAGSQAMADRFAYVPIIGLFIMLVWGVADLRARWRWPRMAVGVLGCLVALACVGSMSRQLSHWQDSITVFTQATAVDPKNFVAHNNLALALGMAGRWDDALNHAHDALRYKPDSPESHSLAAMILDQQKKFAEALVHYEAAARLKPGWPTIHFNLAQSFTRLGKIPEAIEQYTLLAELLPNDPLTRAELARLLVSQQKIAEAIASYRSALTAAPISAPVMNELAWILATHPRAEYRDGAEAVRLAERACELTQRQQAPFLGTLAAAYAEVGRFSDAIQAATQARTLALRTNQTNIVMINENALKLYEARQPYR